MVRWTGTLALVCAVVLILGAVPASAASVENLKVTPDAASANSTWTFSFVWKDDDGRMPSTLEIQIRQTDPEELYEPLVLYYLDETNVTQPALLDGEGQALVLTDGKPPTEGTTFKIRATAGLHFSLVEEVDPEAGRLLHPLDETLIYLPYLMSKDNGAAKPLKFEVRGTVITPAEEEGGEDQVDDFASEDDSEPSFTIHNSYPIDSGIYAGVIARNAPYYGVDTVSGYTSYPDPLTTDPLTTNGIGNEGIGNICPDDPFNPDDGAASTAYIFRVVYSNSGNLAPQQWLHPGDFGGMLPDARGCMWYKGLTTAEQAMVDAYKAGVVLFVARADVEGSEYIALPMEKEDPDDNNYADGVIYRYVFPPAGGG